MSANGLLARLAALCTLVLLGAWPGQAASRAHGARGAPALNVDWPHFGATTDQHRYAALAQVNLGTIGKLGIAWTHDEGPNQALWEADPLVVAGTMYLTTGTGQVLALDAATGAYRWQYIPQINLLSLLRSGGLDVPVSRGVEVANGRVFDLTYDNQLIALDAKTGAVIWHTVVADFQQGYAENSPPTYWHGLLFLGNAQGDEGVRGFVAAYDANTGKQVWRFYTVPAPGHGWIPARGAHGGGAVWMPPTVDTRTGIVYVDTGNPSPDLVNTNRPGCNPWVDATLALDGRTGKLRWARTEVCPDLWDYDSGQSPLLLTVQVHGKPVRAVGTGNKSGYFWLFNAATGATLAKSPALTRETLPRPAPTARGVTVCPGKFGGLEFSPPAYNPQIGLIYVPGLGQCMIYKRAGQAAIDRHQPGAPDAGGTAAPVGNADGFMAALDPATGAIRWRTVVGGPMIGGALTTAGGLVFSGSDDGHFYAFNARTGQICWRANLGLSFGAAPITYMVRGVQYLAIAAGGSSVAQTMGAPIGGTLVVFKLGGAPIHRLPSIQSGARR